MPELRTDWLTGRSVLVAENRALRPDEFAQADFGEMVAVVEDIVPTCPFCSGNESCTPHAVYEKRDSHGQWQLRVVPNAFPAVENLSGAAGDIRSFIHGVAALDLNAEPQLQVPIPGVYEVVIESPLHKERMAGVSSAHLREIVEAYAARLRYWRERGQLSYGLLFKNQGPRAGASLTHIHSQLIALPFVPAAVDAEVGRAVEFFRKSGQCAYCQLIERERALDVRVVFDRDGFIACCPFASIQPSEVWLMPSEHAASFELATAETLDRLTLALHRLLAKLEPLVPHAQYNLLLRTAPWNGDFAAQYHWRIELLPRVNSLAGLELATGVNINPLPPERAAAQLRSA
jgi:UDPglucose--hexose-1-phosphate uridylyltransferase